MSLRNTDLYNGQKSILRALFPYLSLKPSIHHEAMTQMSSEEASSSNIQGFQDPGS